jgi:hypothetical protein
MKLVSTWFPAPRWKQHAAQSGYIYAYIFEGLAGTHEYKFLATSGPSVERRVMIALDPAALAKWSAAQRPLTDVECFGIAKMALLRTFDEAETPFMLPEALVPSYDVVAEICTELDL